jgi:hypothetical protein
MDPIFLIIFYTLAMLMAIVVFILKFTAKSQVFQLTLTLIAKLGGIYVIGYSALMLAKMANII